MEFTQISPQLFEATNSQHPLRIEYHPIFKWHFIYTLAPSWEEAFEQTNYGPFDSFDEAKRHAECKVPFQVKWS
jgi:hypothetical protein